MTTETKVEVLDTIHKIVKSIQMSLKVPKDKKNDFGGFVYRNAEGILEAYKNEVSRDIYPDDLIIIHEFDIKEIGGRLFSFCDSILELGDGTFKKATGFSEIDLKKKGMDQSQLSGAVTSYSKKYALCNLFAIDDSKDDPDSKDNKNIIETISSDQGIELEDLAKSFDFDINIICKAYKIHSIIELPFNKFSSVRQRLKEKKSEVKNDNS